MVAAGLLARNAARGGCARRWTSRRASRPVRAWSPTISRRRTCSSLSTRSASSSSATAAPPASAIPVRSRTDLRNRSRDEIPVWRCSRAIATSLAVSIRSCAPATSPRPRSSSLTRSRARSTSTSTRAARHRHRGRRRLPADLWPASGEVRAAVEASISPELFEREYATIWDGDERWQALPAPGGALFDWDPDSTYVREPSFFQDPTPSRHRSPTSSTCAASSCSEIWGRDESGAADTQRLPHTVRILLEGLLRNAGGLHVREEDVLALAGWPQAPGDGQARAVLPGARAAAGLHGRARRRRPRRHARGDGARGPRPGARRSARARATS